MNNNIDNMNNLDNSSEMNNQSIVYNQVNNYNNQDMNNNINQVYNENIVKSNKGIKITNILISLYNLLNVLVGLMDEKLSIFSILFLIFNFAISVTTLNREGVSFSVIFCIILEIITFLLMIMCIIVSI